MLSLRCLLQPWQELFQGGGRSKGLIGMASQENQRQGSESSKLPVSFTVKAGREIEE